MTGSRTKLYLHVWAVLLALTLVEIGCTWLPITRLTLFGFLIVLATVKAALVAVYYMHLRWEQVLLGIVALSPFPLATMFAVVLILENSR